MTITADAMLIYRQARERLAATGRNAVCPCGSGLKYKKCHLHEDEAARPPRPPSKPGSGRRALSIMAGVASMTMPPPPRRRS